MITFSLADVVSALNAHLIGESVHIVGCSTDSRSLQAGNLFIALRGAHFDGHQFITQAVQQGAAAVLVDQPLDCTVPQLVVADTLAALGALGRWWRAQLPLQHVVAITGSNGKTTVKEMVKAILSTQGPTLATQGNFNNDIGVPLTLFALNATHRYAVIEMGASQLGDIARLTVLAQPTVATVTQCAPAHLAGFGSIEGVAKTKGEIFHGLHSAGVAVVNADDAYADFWQQLITTFNAQQTIYTFALTAPATFSASQVQLTASGSHFHLHTPNGTITIQLPLLGRHNVLNAVNAAACAFACGCSLSAIQQGLAALSAVKGRLQPHAGLNQCTILDDTYNANPTSLNAALAVLADCPGPRWLVLGDMKELGEHSLAFHQQAGQLARNLGIERVWSLGPLAHATATSFGIGGLAFETQADLIHALRIELPHGASILVKGSRSMQMEHVIHALKMDD